jgi:hypothetical protein
MVSWFVQRVRSATKAAALAYRDSGSFCRHLRQIVSRSSSIAGLVVVGAAGWPVLTCSIVSIAVAAMNGGRPVRR